MTIAGLAAESASCQFALKRLVGRTRPYEREKKIQLLVPKESSYSFPSGHSASGFTCAYLLTRLFGKKGALAYIPASLIALSRIYVGVHYVSDVICGMVLGTIVGMLTHNTAIRRERRKSGGAVGRKEAADGV